MPVEPRLRLEDRDHSCGVLSPPCRRVRALGKRSRGNQNKPRRVVLDVFTAADGFDGQSTKGNAPHRPSLNSSSPRSFALHGLFSSSIGSRVPKLFRIHVPLARAARPRMCVRTARRIRHSVPVENIKASRRLAKQAVKTPGGKPEEKLLLSTWRLEPRVSLSCTPHVLFLFLAFPFGFLDGNSPLSSDRFHAVASREAKVRRSSVRFFQNRASPGCPRKARRGSWTSRRKPFGQE